MAYKVKFTLDGVPVEGEFGQTILEAADEAGIYIPRLCSMKELEPHGSCRVCVVKVNGRFQAACTTPISEGCEVQNDTSEILDLRKSMIDMLYVEGNHFCMFCEKSGDCELQALAYRFGITVPQYPSLHPEREVDASHPDIIIDRDRCILCGRCVRSSREHDHKNVFQFGGRGREKSIEVNSEAFLSDTNLAMTDQSVKNCPTGAILIKRIGFSTPLGQRKYDTSPIGSDIEKRGSNNKESILTKPKMATCSLAGCFGCHMSVLDIDDKILELVDVIEFDKSPIVDFKTFTDKCFLGIIEGGCANEENVRVLQDFRDNCEVLVSLGDCATLGGLPSYRNHIPLRECLEEAYVNGPTVVNATGKIPNDEEIPLLLDQVYPCHDIVKIDYHLPGCPPSAESIWQTLVALLTDKPVDLPYNLIKYD